MASLRSRRGQSVVEVLVAITLLALLSTSGFYLLSTAFSESTIAQERVKAEDLLTEGLEAARQIRNQDFTQLSAGTYGLTRTGADWSLSATPDTTDSLFTRSLVVTQVDDDQVDVMVTISWTPRAGRSQTISASTRLTTWAAAPPPAASNCYGYDLTGDWTHPVTLGTGDLGPGNQGTDVVVDYPYAFMSGVASSSSKPDLFAFNVSDAAHPALIGSIDIGSGGINSIALTGTTLVAASSNDSKEFMVFNVADPTHMSLVGTVDLTGTTDALTVMTRDNLAVVGRKTSSASEILFYDITNPAVPSNVYSYDNPGDVNDFAASDNYLYAVTSAANDDIITFNITDPVHPSFVSKFDLGDGTEDLSIAYQDPNTLLTGNLANEFIALDATNPSSMSIVSTLSTGGQVRDVACVSDQMLILGTNNPNQELMLIDISDLAHLSVLASLNFPQEAGGVDFARNMLFVSVRSNDALRIVTSGP